MWEDYIIPEALAEGFLQQPVFVPRFLGNHKSPHINDR
jgi:hypothetical protein